MVDKRQKQAGLWVAGVFSLLGLAFLIYDIYIVFVDQQGRFDLSDKVLMPVAATMLVAGLVSLWLIFKDHHRAGSGLLFYYFVLIPPIVADLLLRQMAAIVVIYIILLSFIMIALVLRQEARRMAVLSAVFAGLIVLGRELWDPPIRVDTELGDFAIVATVVAAR